MFVFPCCSSFCSAGVAVGSGVAVAVAVGVGLIMSLFSIPSLSFLGLANVKIKNPNTKNKAIPKTFFFIFFPPYATKKASIQCINAADFHN